MAILVAAGSAVDYARSINARTALQAAADAAALAGVARLDDGTAAKTSAAIAAYWHNVPQGVPRGGPDPVVTVSGDTVRVAASSEIDTSLMRLINIDSVTVNVVSEAVGVPGPPICILALTGNSTGISFVGSGDLEAQSCQAWSNSPQRRSISFQGAGRVTTAGICAVGGIGRTGVYTVTPEPKDNCPPVGDPLAEWQGPSVGGCDHTNFNEISGRLGTVRLTPGVYCGGLRVETDDIVFEPGVYIMNDGPLVMRGNSTISGEGVGIYLNGRNSYVDMAGTARLELSAPESGAMKGMVLAQGRDSSPGKTNTFTGNATVRLNGTVYVPTQGLKFWGSSDAAAPPPHTQIIAETVEIGGNALLQVRSDPGAALIRPPNGTIRLSE